MERISTSTGKFQQAPLAMKHGFNNSLTQQRLVTEGDFLKAIQTGISRRMVAETNMNAVSSRSHSVFTITVTMGSSSTLLITATRSGEKADLKKRSKIHLIDLAGSERAESTGATGIILTLIFRRQA
jgi:hypothetical protein